MRSDDGPRRSARWFLSYLIGTGAVGDDSWRWRLSTVLAFVGPGSVPLALVLLGPHSEILHTEYSMRWGIVVAVLTSAAIVLARFRPFAAWLLAMASYAMVAVGADTIGSDPWPATVPLMFCLMVVQFAVARERRLGVAVAVWLGTLAAGAWVSWATVNGFLDPVTAGAAAPVDTVNENLTITGTYGALFLVVGLSVRIWRQGRARVAEEEQVAEAERTRRRLLEERARIARELHDIVAHHMSVITVQAQTAEYRVEGLDEDARGEFRSISEQARESLSEMRRLLAVLRGDDQSGPREPVPGPEELDSLVEAVDRAGTPAALTVDELPEDLPESVSLTMYRVVQEALSNVVRHAAGAATEVEVGRLGSKVVITVVNAAPPEGGRATEPQRVGLGLAGMRERVSLLGGSLETGATDAGGYRVRAELPFDARPTPQERSS
ncbi:sensor histidine kinase [Glycomyces xiaoerkulensis]|uniref:sensor histidine kinase n=1 Tax=Glycomyces xiaoerkulensis TaxID=2038139 RepID=UPI000C264BF6|nr:histidine kinase [Glycomyces xiaoerkulensis]